MAFEWAWIKEKHANLDEYIKGLVPDERIAMKDWDPNKNVGFGWQHFDAPKMDGSAYLFLLNPLKVKSVQTIDNKEVFIYLGDEIIKISYTYNVEKGKKFSLKTLKWIEKEIIKKREIYVARKSENISMSPFVFKSDSIIIPLNYAYYRYIKQSLQKYATD